MDLQKLKKDLMAKGISVVASTNEITAGLAWSVEGIEKVPRLGELLFYKVNGVEYGVKPSKGNKHDIHWYYDQLKTGMKGAKGYSAGLTQFLNVWVKKGELVIVYKSGKPVESACEEVTATNKEKVATEKLGDISSEVFGFIDDVNKIKYKGVQLIEAWAVHDKTSFSTNEPCDAVALGFPNKLRYKCSDEKRMLSKKISLIYPVTSLAIERFKKWENKKNRFIFKKNSSKSYTKYLDFLSEDTVFVMLDKIDNLDTLCSTLADILSDIKLDFRNFGSYGGAKFYMENKATSGTEVTSASPRKYRPSIRERMDRNDAMLDPLEYPMNIRGIIKKYNEFKKKVDDISILGIKPFRAYIDTSNYEDADGIIPVVYVDIRNGKIKINCVDNEKARLFDNLDSINSKYKFKVLDISDYNISFDAFTSRNELGRSDTFEVSEKDFDSFARDLKRDCAILEDTLKVYSSVKVVASPQLVSETGIDNLLLSELSINADKKTLDDGTSTWSYKRIKITYKDPEDFATVTCCGKNTKCSTIVELRDAIEDCLKSCSSKPVTADLKEGEEYEEVDTFIKDVNGLTIGGKRVFNAEKKGEDIKINLLLKHFETPDMDRLNELVEDNLEILFPITQKWMDADKGQTFGNTKKVGDIVLYTNDWSSQEFADSLLIERNSKIDYDDLCNELATLYNVLAKDCSELETNLFKVTADVCEVKETLGELNEENFEGINKEHDRLMYIKVTPEQFLQLWKTSPNFNGQQIQKIVYGFKLALRTLNSKFENKGILIECFYKKKDGKGYIRVEYDKDLYIIYVSRAEDNGEVKVITRKMRKVIPTKNFNILSTSVSSLAFERSNLPSGFKPIWEEVSK